MEIVFYAVLLPLGILAWLTGFYGLRILHRKGTRGFALWVYVFPAIGFGPIALLLALAAPDRTKGQTVSSADAVAAPHLVALHPGDQAAAHAWVMAELQARGVLGRYASGPSLPGTLVLTHRKHQWWTIVLAIILFPIGLLFLLVVETRTLVVALSPEPGGGTRVTFQPPSALARQLEGLGQPVAPAAPVAIATPVPAPVASPMPAPSGPPLAPPNPSVAAPSPSAAAPNPSLAASSPPVAAPSPAAAIRPPDDDEIVVTLR